MRILLDTHVLLWVFSDDKLLSEKARRIITDPYNEIYFSIVSVWEIAIKHLARPDKLKISEEEFMSYCETSGFYMLQVKAEHVYAIKSLKRNENAPQHKDPFDRMLMAQAKIENMKLITHDSLLEDYNELCIVII